VIQKSNNFFLVKLLHSYENALDDVLQNFYYYLLDKSHEPANNTKKSNQLSILLNAIKYTDLSTVDNKFITNTYFYFRNTVLKNNNEFLKLFDSYEKQNKINMDTLIKIEKCIKENGLLSYNELVSEYIESNNDSRAYDIEYLRLLHNEIQGTQCKEYVKNLKDFFDLRIQTQSLEEYDLDDKKEFYDIYQKSSIFNSPEKLIIDKTFSSRLAYTFTYIHRLLNLPSILLEKERKWINVSLIQDLCVMWAVQTRANEDTTLGRTKKTIQAAYLGSGNMRSDKERWLSSVVSLIQKLAEKHYEYDKHSNLISDFNLEQFDIDLDFELNLDHTNETSFLSTNIYHYELNDFISIKAAANKFEKYFTTEDTEATQYSLHPIQYLFANGQNNGIFYQIKYLLETKESTTLDSKKLDLLIQSVKKMFCKAKYTNDAKVDDYCIKYISKIID
jgi:glutaredoxin-related protein